MIINLFIKFGPFMYFPSGLINIRNILITSFIIQLILSIFIFSKFSKRILEHTIINVFLMNIII